MSNLEETQSIKSCNVKNPPKLTEGTDYEQWRHNVAVWIELTDLEKPKLGLALHMALEGRAQIASSELTIAQLKHNDGVDKILEKLDAIFLPETGRRQFATFRELYRLRRDESMNIDKFISNFEHIAFRLKSLAVNLPDSVLAFLLLEATNLEESQNQLILSSMTEIKYDAMKAALRRVFGGQNPSQKFTVIKTEKMFDESCSETLYARGMQQQFPARGRGSYRGRGGQSSYRGSQFTYNNSANYAARYNNNNYSRKENVKDQDGNVLRCIICGSKFHFAKQCPDSYEKLKENKDSKEVTNSDFNNAEQVQLSLLVAYAKQSDDSKLTNLV